MSDKKLIGWRMADYTRETDDIEVARNWSNAVDVLPVFEGDVNTGLGVKGGGEAVRAIHADWSNATFGADASPLGPLRHMLLEVQEVIENTDDLLEWADVQLLFWDALRRAGVTDEQLHQACLAKMEINMRRTWRPAQDGEPRLHQK